MSFKILRSMWYTPPAPTPQLAGVSIGIVAIAVGPDKGDWKAYIGYGTIATNSDADEQQIAMHGHPLGSPQLAHAFFPLLPIEKYKG